MPTVYFIRHAESVANAGGATATPDGIDLTPKGHAQAQALADYFEQPPSLIVASSYVRTQQTCAPLRQKFPQVPYEIWPVHEFTYLDVLTNSNTTPEQRRPAVEAYWQKAQPDYVDGEGAESFNQMLGRIQQMKERLQRLSLDNVCVFTHGQIIKAMLAQAEYPTLPAQETMRLFLKLSQENPIHNRAVIKAKISQGQFQFESNIWRPVL